MYLSLKEGYFEKSTTIKEKKMFYQMFNDIRKRKKIKVIIQKTKFLEKNISHLLPYYSFRTAGKSLWHIGI